MNVSRLALLLRVRPAALSALALAAIVSSAQASTINVVNGSFEQTTLNQSSQFGSAYSQQQVNGWSTSGYNFVFQSGTADTTGANGVYGNIKLWGPNDGSNNGLTASSPDGGNFLALDGAYGVQPVSQTLSGLTVGAATTVSFYFAGAQQAGYNGGTTEQLKVSLGNQTIATPVLQNVEHGFTGWQQYNFVFDPTSTSEVLSFLAVGTPNGAPPMSLLDGVSVTDTTPSPVPEPASITLMMTGLASLGGMVRSRMRKSA